MNYFQIEAFLCIANVQSLSKAAELLYVSQSTISHRLSTLEEELGITLVIRRKGYRTVELTPAGERFLPIARRWDALWEETTKLEQAEPVISLNIGGVDSVSTYFVGIFYKIIREKEPSLNLFVHLCNDSTQVYALLENREIDIAFVTVPIWNKNIILEPILSEPFKLLRYAPGQVLPANVSPRDLDASREVFQPWGPEYQQWHDYWWPVPQHPYLSCDTTGMVETFLSDENLWTIVPESIARAFAKRPGFQAINLDSPPPRHIGYLAVHRHPKQSSVLGIKLFEKHLRKFLAKQDLAYKSSP